jgi:hypothetical protein
MLAVGVGITVGSGVADHTGVGGIGDGIKTAAVGSGSTSTLNPLHPTRHNSSSQPSTHQRRIKTIRPRVA